MQALIDYDGWRKWKDFSQTNADNEKSSTKESKAKDKKKKGHRASLGSNSGTAVTKSIMEENEDVAKEPIVVKKRPS